MPPRPVKISLTPSIVWRTGERILLERRGKVVAALVPAADVELLERLEDRLDLEEARALADVEKHGTVSWEKVKAELRRRRRS
jgi:antitoxin (DNA-binding transcriptional repressor) of toxin-antitoxin stability system